MIEVKRLELNQLCHLDDTFWEVVSAAVEKLRHRAGTVAQGDKKFSPEADPRIPPTKKGVNKKV